MAQECPFCRIAAGENDTDVVYHDDQITAFWDRNPAAPVHILVIPNRHVESLNEMGNEDTELLGRMVLKAREIAEEHEIAVSGYRVFINTGPDGGQSVFHLHLHLMGGRHLGMYR